jgi:hypothetical protein
MEKIKDTVINVMQGITAQKAAKGDRDPEKWLKKILTKKELAHIKFHYFKKGTLGLFVDSSSWLYSFSLKKKHWLAELHAVSCAIKDIRFRIGAIR